MEDKQEIRKEYKSRCSSNGAERRQTEPNVNVYISAGTIICYITFTAIYRHLPPVTAIDRQLPPATAIYRQLPPYT